MNQHELNGVQVQLPWWRPGTIYTIRPAYEIDRVTVIWHSPQEGKTDCTTFRVAEVEEFLNTGAWERV